MESRLRCVGGEVGGGTVPLDLIHPIKGDVEPVAALIFDDRNFNGALADEHLLDAAIDPDAVLEVDDVITGLERREALECSSGCIPPRPPESPLPPENFVIGEHAESRKLFAAGWNEEPAIEHADRQVGR